MTATQFEALAATKAVVSRGAAARACARKTAEAQEALQRADAKAGTLLQLVGLELAGVMALLATTPSSAAVAMLGTALAPTLIAVVLLLLTILPRLGSPLPGTWLHAAADARALTSASTTGDATTGDASDTGLGAEERRLRRVACRAYQKYRYLQVAVWLLITGLVPLTAGVALIA